MLYSCRIFCKIKILGICVHHYLQKSIFDYKDFSNIFERDQLIKNKDMLYVIELLKYTFYFGVTLSDM